MFETNRLRIREFSSSDFTALHDLFSDAESMRFIGPRRPMSDVETQDWLNEQILLQASSITRHAVALKSNDELIGVCGIKLLAGVRDFGYFFRRSYWGKGFAFEACHAILDLLTESPSTVNYQIFVAKENLHSQRLLVKLGFNFGPLSERDGEAGYFVTRE
ncbi:MAG: GNAT family N-acetyltransferase [Methylococcaceae bacterium]|nr:GNAT family N-acetyltransferase [Methylococcaceae bacterium]MDP3903592.1 GNAT family N-acetyltransferase [Methylococcaceae bacterium]